MANAVGRITDTLIAVSRLIYAGHVKRFANAKILIGIGGAGLPYVLGRLMRNASLDDSLGDPREALSMMYYDTLLHDPAALRLLLDTVGADRVMLGSDMPFPIGDPTPRAILDGAGVSAADRDLIESGVASSLLGL
jgi:aminocarboxymuconate-semialdehyde decarboxylase